jgi:hypothetical protein
LDRSGCVDALMVQDSGQARGHAEGIKGCQGNAICLGVSPTAGSECFGRLRTEQLNCYDVRTARGESSTG